MVSKQASQAGALCYADITSSSHVHVVQDAFCLFGFTLRYSLYFRNSVLGLLLEPETQLGPVWAAGKCVQCSVRQSAEQYNTCTMYTNTGDEKLFAL